MLASLDLSHNELSSLPVNLFALPNLNTLNLSHNALTSLPFNAPFLSSNSNSLARTNDPRGEWFCQNITRATVPLPRLVALNVSNNQLTAESIRHEKGCLPAALVKLDLSGNPLGRSVSLLRALSKLSGLVELRAEKASIGEDSFPVDLLVSQGSSPSQGMPFPSLKVLDLGETPISRPVVEAAFLPTVIKQELDFEVTAQEPKEGTLRVILGKKVVKEPWEIEAERRTARGRGVRHAPAPSVGDPFGGPPLKEAWEIEAEQGLLTEGAKRRARAAALAASKLSPAPVSAAAKTPANTASPKTPVKVVEKEPWEIEAEQGLLTAGGKRRARAAAAAAALSVSTTLSPATGPSSATSAASGSPTRAASSVLSQSQYYTAESQTLTLPPSLPPSKAQHARSFSLAPASMQAMKAKSDPGLAIPTPTLPLVPILAQTFAHSLRTLILANRRMDPAFGLPLLDGAEGSGPFLPCLEELSLENCNLGNTVSVFRSANASGSDLNASRKNEPLLPLLGQLFPSLRTLDLSYNVLKSDALDKDSLAGLILASDPDDSFGHVPRKGLRHLRLRGNRITELDGFQALADMFKGNRDIPTWKLEELDLRDNEIGKLPPEVGLLPLEVFLVDGNVYVSFISAVLTINYILLF